jgi:hypothetical protein
VGLERPGHRPPRSGQYRGAPACRMHPGAALSLADDTPSPGREDRVPERTEKARKKRNPRGGDLDASTPTTAAHQLERILYILPAAAQEGGAALDELASRLGVAPDTVSTDLTDVTARAYYHPADSGSELQIELTSDRVSIWTTGEFQRPVSLSMPEAVCLGLALRGAPQAETSAALTHLESTLARARTPELLEEMEAADLRPGPGGIRDTVTGALQEKTALRMRYLQDRPLDRRAGIGGVGQIRRPHRHPPGGRSPLDRPARPSVRGGRGGAWAGGVQGVGEGGGPTECDLIAPPTAPWSETTRATVS